MAGIWFRTGSASVQNGNAFIEITGLGGADLRDHVRRGSIAYVAGVPYEVGPVKANGFDVIEDGGYAGSTASGVAYKVAPWVAGLEGATDALEEATAFVKGLGEGEPYDDTRGRLLRVGDFGMFSGKPVIPGSGDLNTLLSPGAWRFLGGDQPNGWKANTPGTYGVVVEEFSASYVMQTAYRLTSPYWVLRRRINSGSSVEPWERIDGRFDEFTDGNGGTARVANDGAVDMMFSALIDMTTAGNQEISFPAGFPQLSNAHGKWAGWCHDGSAHGTNAEPEFSNIDSLRVYADKVTFRIKETESQPGNDDRKVWFFVRGHIAT